MDSDDDREIIRRNCKRFREEAGWTQQGLAERAGLALSSITKYEAGKATPDRENMHAMAVAFGLQDGDFYKKDPPSVSPIPEARLKVSDDAPQDIVEEVRDFQRRINRKLLERAMAEKAKMRKKKP